MPLYFSPAHAAFYDDGFHSIIPADALEISQARHAELMEEQGAGRIIAAGPDGLPITLDPPAPSTDHLLAWMRRRRNRLLAECDHTQMPDVTLSEARREAWREYRQALRDLPETTTDLTAIEWPVPPA
ncbi:phage tail protein [Sphingobium fuliginis ATCC 27551]|uniref:Phage tail protein n=2 Tax=Sphingobium fuliginis (strain ATCC 27551) TaxID=336203 RepID=A0A5B8CM00_SPHSA|nr:phage tail protein [Sphingobium fuliginis ATCC 27551]